MKTIYLSLTLHEGRKYWLAEFAYDPAIIQILKPLSGAFWHPGRLGWMIPVDFHPLAKIREVLGKHHHLKIESFLLEQDGSLGMAPSSFKSKKTIYLQRIVHKGQARVKLTFSFDKDLIELIRKIHGRMYSKTFQGWHLPARNTPEILNDLYGEYADFRWLENNNLTQQQEVTSEPKPKKVSYSDFSRKDKKVKKPPRLASAYRDLTPKHKEELTKMVEQMQLENKSLNTIRTYSAQIKMFWQYYHERLPNEIQEADLRKYLLHLVNDKDASESYQNQAINSIKFYYERILGWTPRAYYIQRPERGKKLPTVLSKEEVKLLLDNVRNIKHKAALSLMYSAGMRIGEVLNLKIEDIDPDRMLIFIRKAKGKKDRTTMLSSRALSIIEEYLSEYNPREWLFNGEKGGKYSYRSLQQVFRRAKESAGIRKQGGTHILRHSFATHLLENGTDLRYIQEILGHESSETTEIYTHVSTRDIQRIASPFEDFE